MVFLPTTSGNMNLQSTISAASATSYDGVAPVTPHHPITCAGNLYYDEEGVMSCEHAKCERGDPRTQACTNHSIAILLIELASKL